jgi:hypothetical protein
MKLTTDQRLRAGGRSVVARLRIIDAGRRALTRMLLCTVDVGSGS